MIFLVCGSFLVFVFATCLYWRFNHAGRLMAKIPGISGRSWPVFGNMFDLLLSKEEMFYKIRQMYREDEPINKLTAFNIRFVNIYEPKDIELILSTPRFNEKRDPYTFLSPWLCEGLLISNGAKWSLRRKILTPAFHFCILRQFSRSFADHAAILLVRLQEASARKTEARRGVDVVPLVARATLTVMCETSMGTSMHEGLESVSQKYFDAIQFLGSSIVHRTSRLWLHSSRIFSWSSTAMHQQKAVKDLHSFTDKIIMERKLYRQSEAHKARLNNDEEVNMYTGKKSRMAMLDLLLNCADEGKIDAVGVREEVDTFMFEGHDTTAMAVCFMLMSVANEPRVQELIYEEQCRIMGTTQRAPTLEQLAEMKYLESCVKETLRLYPSVPYIARYLHEDVELGGCMVPAGTVCNIHVFDIHRRASLYPEPLAFRPERFLGGAAPPHVYAYIPFSAGPRNCIGQKFAMLELKTLMSAVVRRFKLVADTTPQQLRFCTDLTLKVSHPIYVEFVDRCAT